MNLVFDLGGVVFRWQPDEFLTRLLPERAPTRAAGRELGAAFFQGFGGDWGEFDRGHVEPALLAERVAMRTGLSVAEARRVIDAIPDELQPMPDTVGLLRRLHAAGRRLFFLSNMPVPYARHLEATHDVLELFERGVFSSRVGSIKPEPALFAHAASTFGVDAAQLVLIDDTLANVEAARRAGWCGLLFENAHRCEADLMRLGLS